jgi:hypothetical protein
MKKRNGLAKYRGDWRQQRQRLFLARGKLRPWACYRWLNIDQKTGCCAALYQYEILAMNRFSRLRERLQQRAAAGFFPETFMRFLHSGC